MATPSMPESRFQTYRPPDDPDEIICSPEWDRDRFAERYLTEELPTPWAYVRDVPIGLINAARSLKNNARPGATTEQQYIDTYTESMRRGEPLPAMVAFAERDGTYTLAGGNHRLPAAKAVRREVVDLYVIHCYDLGNRFAIAQNLNRAHGRSISQAIRYQQALDYMDQFAKKPRETAALYGLPESGIHGALRDRERVRRFERAGLRPGAVPVKQARRLNQIPNDGPLCEAHNLTEIAKLTEPEVAVLVREMKLQHSEVEQIAIVVAWRARDDLASRIVQYRRRPGIQASPGQRTQSRLFGYLNAAASLLARHPTRSRLGLTEETNYERAVALAGGLHATLQGMGGLPQARR